MATNQACLDALGTFGNKDVEEHQEQINQEIENFKSFYEQQGVPEGKIFLSAVVSAKKIIELCQDVDFVTIQLAKENSSVTDLSDCKFIISQCDKHADIIPESKHFGIRLKADLDFNDLQNFKAKFMDAACCRNPPGGQ